MGTNLVSLGFVSEEVLMDFLAHQTGVPRMDFHNLSVDPEVLKRIPKRLAEQLTILPIDLKDQRILVLAMADPSDLNAIDSARFASGLTIDPVVASHSALRAAIAEQYKKLEAGAQAAATGEDPSLNLDEALPVNFELPPRATAGGAKPVPGNKPYPMDPFFDGPPTDESIDPFGLFDTPAIEPPTSTSPGIAALLQSAGPTGTVPGGLIPYRNAKEGRPRLLETFQTRALVTGLVRLLQKRGVLGEDELQRFLTILIESGQMREDGHE